MFEKLIVTILFVSTTNLYAQKAISAVNMASRYNPDSSPEIGFKWLNKSDLIITYISKSAFDKVSVAEYKSYRDKRSIREFTSESKCNGEQCMVYFEIPEIKEGYVLILKMNRETDKSDYYYEVSSREEGLVPVMLKTGEGFPVLGSYVKASTTLMPEIVEGTGNEVHVYYYAKKFEFADPPTGIRRLPGKNLEADSVFTLKNREVFSPTATGLYFMQSDTTVWEGLAFRVEDRAFPAYNSLEHLSECMRYITTASEWKKLNVANLSKKEFDEVWLSMAGNELGATNAIREYFRRIKSSNRYFTTYKEGWKTDMGMIYTIFGPPEEVYIKRNYEIWKYGSTVQHGRLEFSFQKSTIPFTNKQYVLMRDEIYKLDWHRTIDLVRKGMDR